MRAADELVNGYLQQMTVQPSVCARGCSVFVAYDGTPEVRPFCNTAARLKLDHKLIMIANCLRQPSYYYMACGVSARCIPEVEQLESCQRRFADVPDVDVDVADVCAATSLTLAARSKAPATSHLSMFNRSAAPVIYGVTCVQQAVRNSLK